MLVLVVHKFVLAVSKCHVLVARIGHVLVARVGHVLVAHMVHALAIRRLVGHSLLSQTLFLLLTDVHSYLIVV